MLEGGGGARRSAVASPREVAPREKKAVADNR